VKQIKCRVETWGKGDERSFPGCEVRIYLSNPMTGCRAPARRTSFFILGEEWTRFPITPTCNSIKFIASSQ